MPQPIDPVSELARVSAAERVQLLMERNAQLAQFRSAETAAQDAQRQHEQVLQADQKKAQVEEELKRKNPFMGRRKRRSPDDPEKEGDAPEHFETYNAHQQREPLDDDEHNLDITL